MKKELVVGGKTKTVIRTSLGLRDALFDELDAIRDGRSTPQRAASMSKLASQIISSVRIEIDHQKYLSSIDTNPGDLRKLTPVLLGNRDADLH